MPEYLAPGVYVEEIDSGAKPIEGVSTSTAGVVGMAERGPTDIPILITSAGEYARWFGGYLEPADFVNPPGRVHAYLPHAVEGFFTNGGKRLYVVRVAPRDAARATTDVFWRPDGVALGETVLLRAAGQGSGMAVGLYVLDAANFAAADRIRVGDGSRAEYMTVGVVSAAATRHIPLDGPVTRAHGAGSSIREHAANALGGGIAGTLAADAARGAVEIFVTSANNLAGVALPWLISLSGNGLTDIVPVTAAVASGPTDWRLTLNQPLRQDYAATLVLGFLQSEAVGARVLETDGTPGDIIVFATTNGGAAGQIIELERGTPNHEVRQSGQLANFPIAQPAYAALPAGTRVDHVTLADNGAITAKALTAALNPGARTLQLDNRVDLVVGQVLRINVAPAEEYVTIVAIPGERGPAPDAGAVTIAQPVERATAIGTAVTAQLPPGFGANPSSQLATAAAESATSLLVASGAGWVAGAFARVVTPSGETYFHRLSGPAAAAAPRIIQLTTNLVRSHQVGEPAMERERLFEVRALDVGGWGNRLMVSAENEETGLANTRALVLTPPLQFTVESLTGIEAGSLIQLRNPANGASLLFKARRVDRDAGAVILDPPGLTAAALATLGPIVDPLEVRSQEFRLTILLRNRPDPAVPSRNNQIMASEMFRNLSLDHRHSRYFQQLIGATNGALRLEDNRPEGESVYVRVLDSLAGAATEAIRPGPEILTDLLPGDVVQPARQALANGNDAIALMGDPVYLGTDDPEPQLRTGLASLRNIPQVSLVSIPGQSTAALQAGVIAHCELMRYRFAVLDSRTPEASLNDVQAQRQQFDSKYAALYYPWLTIPDPTPDNLAAVPDFPLPPSGHVLGIYARTDEERGVHKAPANEVVRGITGLTRILQKGEHDILNPSPVNINVIRDFRPDGRSIRVWGARCITSDQAYKYVPVRRLLIFLEQSIERGLQWVVFEPNAEPLWARVTQTVSNFLTDVWRAGALEGTEPGQGFFVKCDRTTMTQSDIDNGRLICVVGVAPVKPAEFVIIRIGLMTRTSEA
jgi:phage tail sheath protein FI